MAIDWITKKNDLLPILDVVLEDADGPVDLSGVTSLNFKMILKSSLGGTPKVSAAAVPDPDQATNTGKVTYTWQSGDTDTPGVYYGEFEALYGTNPLTFPNNSYYIVEIVDDVDENV